MQKARNSLFFDRRDYELLAIIDRALDQGGGRVASERNAFGALLHPHGILELATSHAERMAMAVINLLGSLEAGQAEDRLMALRTLHDEVLHSAQTTFRYNTGRVLIQVMKEIVRTRGDEQRRLMLAHDFRQAATGNPRLVRRLLRQHHLLEMPENKSQLAMDHHVHDSNTKGRKNPTHLLMDAWIKGLRFLTIIYYNHVTLEAVSEVFKAAEILDISVRIGLEYRVPFRGRQISLVWEPGGFADRNDALAFLANPAVQESIQRGRAASAWAAEQVLAVLTYWNEHRRPAINQELGLDMPPLDKERFLAFVGTGQASFLHLAEMLHRWALPSLKLRFHELEGEARGLEAAPEPRDAQRIAAVRLRMRQLDELTSEVMLNTWLNERGPARFPVPGADAPPIMTQAPHELVERMSALRADSNILLNLADLTPEDVLELLWDCKGKISHLEIFNLKDWQEGRTPHLKEISRIQQALNEGGPLHLKQILQAMVHHNECHGTQLERCTKLRDILRNIPTLQAPYLIKPLRSRIGTDSTSNAGMRHGMGMVLPETLPRHVQRQLRHEYDEARILLPIRLNIFPRISYLTPDRRQMLSSRFTLWVRRITGWVRFGSLKKWEWMIYSNTARIEEPGNVITIGGIAGSQSNRFSENNTPSADPERPGLRYLNTAALNTLKVASGLAAAMLTFIYTQQWWVLAWFGAIVWFAITALRNVAQAVLSGGGIIQTSLLRWNDYVNGSRVCDSLMYTGYSVPLLELGIRYLLLERGLGITVASSPVLVFSCIAVANGLYIAGHNVYRGFPRAAIIGNMFRSVLAIPCAILYHDALLVLLTWAGVASPLAYLQLGAAIVSKTASDTVAGLIEGIADRRNSLRLRYWDYKTKVTQLFDTYTRMEMAHPEADILRLLPRPGTLFRFAEQAGTTLHVAAIINALDLMYFWNYQPQAQRALRDIVRVMTEEERLILSRSQLVLIKVREVSQLFVNGLVGEHFASALAFYLDRHSEYIRDMNALCLRGRPPGEASDADEADDQGELPDLAAGLAGLANLADLDKSAPPAPADLADPAGLAGMAGMDKNAPAQSPIAAAAPDHTATVQNDPKSENTMKRSAL